MDRQHSIRTVGMIGPKCEPSLTESEPYVPIHSSIRTFVDRVRTGATKGMLKLIYTLHSHSAPSSHTPHVLLSPSFPIQPVLPNPCCSPSVGVTDACQCYPLILHVIVQQSCTSSMTTRQHFADILPKQSNNRPKIDHELRCQRTILPPPTPPIYGQQPQRYLHIRNNNGNSETPPKGNLSTKVQSNSHLTQQAVHLSKPIS